MRAISGPRIGTQAVRLLIGLIASVVAAKAQTVFTLSSTATNYTTGAAVQNATPNSGIASVGASFSSTGPVEAGVTGLTFGQSFRVGANGTGTQAGTAAWLFDGTHAGSSITSGTFLPIRYEFTLAKNTGITSPVTWTLYFKDGSSADTAVATGVMSAASANITGTTSYQYTATVAAPATFRAYLDVSFTGNIAMQQGFIDVTMTNTGFGGGGISLGASAIPEPSTYALLAGVACLGAGVWHRRRRSAAT